MIRTLISELKEKDNVLQTFIVKEKNLSLGKNGRPFLSLSLGDKTGSLDAKMWDQVEDAAKNFEIGDIVLIKGVIQLFQNRKQLIIHKIDKVDHQQVEMTEFIATSKVDAQALFLELIQIVKTMKNSQLKQLVMDTLEDPEIKPLFLKAPAAKSIHHAWVGGLIEHVVSMTKILVFMGDHYNFLNKDLLVFGAIFHDLGKIWELSYDSAFSYTDRGRLIGHMEMACELIDKKSARILGFNQELRDICKHIVLSHHGKYEYGSPKRPKFLEALLVAMVDDLDSKVSTVHSWVETEKVSSVKWSRLNELFDRYFLLDDLKEKFES